MVGKLGRRMGAARVGSLRTFYSENPVVGRLSRHSRLLFAASEMDHRSFWSRPLDPRFFRFFAEIRQKCFARRASYLKYRTYL